MLPRCLVTIVHLLQDLQMKNMFEFRLQTCTYGERIPIPLSCLLLPVTSSLLYLKATITFSAVSPSDETESKLREVIAMSISSVIVGKVGNDCIVKTQ